MRSRLYVVDHVTNPTQLPLPTSDYIITASIGRRSPLVWCLTSRVCKLSLTCPRQGLHYGCLGEGGVVVGGLVSGEMGGNVHKYEHIFLVFVHIFF